MEVIRNGNKSGLSLKWRLKACPRKDCHGDLYTEHNHAWVCFQCGYIEYNKKEKLNG